VGFFYFRRLKGRPYEYKSTPPRPAKLSTPQRGEFLEQGVSTKDKIIQNKTGNNDKI
jgi:hypothetical protein